MRRFAQFLVVSGAAAILTTGRTQEAESVLRAVAERVRPVLAELKPAPIVEYPEHSQSLLISYRPQKFLVHGQCKTGEWSTNLVEEIGPSFTGFVLRVHVQRLGEVNQAVTQTLHEPYWQTFLDVTPIAVTTNQVYWALSFAGRTDEKLLANIKQALGSLAQSRTSR
jgi:hypothetical protein